ncbi:hypothetical protein GUJ93_ZPchr0001g30938 [Zizania palustris]|uniref:Uncharacterized protein n=1 Tax=Zizania palustris TaxID=103762 RepID=A0A8J5VAZ2_ZIZPA|nr:hypothetical protein GUJ93_ZPchr0001g30938 [Zizania palustris]
MDTWRDRMKDDWPSRRGALGALLGVARLLPAVPLLMTVSRADVTASRARRSSSGAFSACCASIDRSPLDRLLDRSSTARRTRRCVMLQFVLLDRPARRLASYLYGAATGQDEHDGHGQCARAPLAVTPTLPFVGTGSSTTVDCGCDPTYG